MLNTYSFAREKLHSPGHLIAERGEVPRSQGAALPVHVIIATLSTGTPQETLQFTVCDVLHNDE